MKWIAWSRAQLLRITDRLGPSRVPAAPPPESLRVRSPDEGTRWTCVERQRISWQCSGSLWHPCDVLLERRTDEGWSLVALLAAHVDPRSLGTSVVVPELPAGPYRVLITSPELPTAVCSPPLEISRS
ncbi:hypothetical protein [Streptomyces sp. SP18CS02]|uniref:hypothetical protein n=1 Tax=Streptomyces sp. SP18CS02 TaxID=3002531 RepID=UPI002E76E4F1|nr:hypothetical protein [Streptomyces sp. SP18CS02]MEE1753189.1 hypothetical protein [Streptomyces sp. SP18CS02]